MTLSFRWLGAAGVELSAGGQVLAIDPFFTRPSLLGMLRPVHPDTTLVKEILPQCEAVLVTHSHWDHLMDVPTVVQTTGARVLGSANTCKLLSLSGVPGHLLSEVHPSDRVTLGVFEVEVLAGRHSWIPFSQVFNGRLKPDLRAPLRLQDYRMDVCLGYRITVMGVHLVVCAGTPQPADILFVVAQEPRRYYMDLFTQAQPDVVVPIHWDDFTRPLSQPLRRFTRPGRMSLSRLVKLAKRMLPQATVIIPEIFKEYCYEGRSSAM